MKHFEKMVEKALKQWEAEETLQDPKFVFKHAIRLQGLFLDNENKIFDHKGKLYATLGEVNWKNDNIIEAKIKLNTSIKFIPITVDISRLK